MPLSGESFGDDHPSTYGEAPKQTMRTFELSEQAYPGPRIPGKVAVEATRVKFDSNDEREEAPEPSTQEG